MLSTAYNWLQCRINKSFFVTRQDVRNDVHSTNAVSSLELLAACLMDRGQSYANHSNFSSMTGGARRTSTELNVLTTWRQPRLSPRRNIIKFRQFRPIAKISSLWFKVLGGMDSKTPTKWWGKAKRRITLLENVTHWSRLGLWTTSNSKHFNGVLRIYQNGAISILWNTSPAILRLRGVAFRLSTRPTAMTISLDYRSYYAAWRWDVFMFGA